MEIGKIIAIGLVGTIFAVLLKKENPQLAMLLAALMLVCVGTAALADASITFQIGGNGGGRGRLFCSGAEGDRHCISDAVRRTALRRCGRGNGCGKN